MSVSLAWQTMDWLRLVRAPLHTDSATAVDQPSPVVGQRLQHLFGASLLSGDAPAPATSMRLTLLGSFVHADPARSSAILSLDGGAARRFGIDSEISDGVRLHAVHADHIELMRNGRRESLAFPRSQSPTHVPETPAPDAVDQLSELEAGNIEQLRERMDALRQQMEASGTLEPETDTPEPPTESE
ncbi:type II secretion system protein N [Pseudomonas sp.]|uniref:type II secretion system protein N n=1 Tax=Pseudomonas sp. TaxID=306 RepID=UPI003D0F39C7